MARSCPSAPHYTAALKIDLNNKEGQCSPGICRGFAIFAAPLRWPETNGGAPIGDRQTWPQYFVAVHSMMLPKAAAAVAYRRDDRSNTVSPPRRRGGRAAGLRARLYGGALRASSRSAGTRVTARGDRRIGSRGRTLNAPAMKREDEEDSELVALDVADLEETEDGMRVAIRRSKTDQEGKGEVIAIVRGSVNCPVKALRKWLQATSISEGPLFRALKHNGQHEQTDQNRTRSHPSSSKRGFIAIRIDCARPSALPSRPGRSRFP
jgi:hypothetical protein